MKNKQKNEMDIQVIHLNDKENPFKKIKQMDTTTFDATGGFVCDVNTGICGPITEKKEGK